MTIKTVAVLMAIAACARSEPARSPTDTDMIRIPAGTFVYGCDDAHETDVGGECADSWRRPEPPSLPDYWIDRLEVTTANYLLCVAAKVCPKLNAGPGSPSPGVTLVGDQPALVEWADARTYCSWRSKRLPTEAEWEKAARGTDGRFYPWGNEPPTCDKVWVQDSCFSQTLDWVRPVGKHPADASPYGVMDMLGNAQEWVENAFTYNRQLAAPTVAAGDDVLRVVKGMSNIGWETLAAHTRRYPKDPRGESVNPGVGFRCARDTAPDQ